MPIVLIRHSAYVHAYIKSLLSALSLCRDRKDGFVVERVMRDSRDLGIIPTCFLCEFGQVAWVPILKTPMRLLNSAVISGVGEQDRLDMWKSVGSKEALIFPYFSYPSMQCSCKINPPLTILLIQLLSSFQSLDPLLCICTMKTSSQLGLVEPHKVVTRGP